MSKFLEITRAGLIRRWLCLAGLALLLTLILPSQLLAAPPSPAGEEPCVQCHQDETDAWQDSPHATTNAEAGLPGATCEDCHGSYVEDHPKAGVQQLTVDSSTCQDCHEGTSHQWEETTHAQAGVQCISCHQSHSQEFRLTDEALCSSCHRDQLENFSHTAHGQEGVLCTDCHASSTPVQEWAMADTGETQAIATTNHDFTAVSLDQCMNCHGEDVHTWTPAAEHAADAELLALAKQVPALTTELESQEQSNKTLKIMTPVSLGLGLGIGGILGIVSMLIVGYMTRGGHHD